MKALIFLFLLCTSFSFQTWAFEIPQLTGPVVDQVGILSQSTQNQLTQILQQAHQNNGPQIQVLVISSLDGLSIEEAAIKIFDQWKLGAVKESNGLLFLIAPHEKKLRIEVGRGLEGDIPDAIAKRIISDTVVPYFKRSEFSAGIVQGVQSILYYAKAQVVGADPSAEPVADQPADSHQSAPSRSNYIFLIILLFVILRAIFGGGRGGGGGLWMLGGGGGGWSGSSGGGGWSGGGGSSAGGGSSGSW